MIFVRAIISIGVTYFIARIAAEHVYQEHLDAASGLHPHP